MTTVMATQVTVSPSSDNVTVTAKIDHINDHGLRVGSFPFYMMIGAVSSITVVILIAVVILMIYVAFRIRSKTFKFSPPVGQILRHRQKLIDNSNLEEVVQSSDISVLPDAGLDSEQNLPQGPPILFNLPL